MYRFNFSDDKTFELNTNVIEDIYAFIHVKWSVQQFQVRFEEASKYRGDLFNVILTNKLGEEFACIGILYDSKCNPKLKENEEV